MKRMQLIWLVVYSISVLVFGWAVYTRLEASYYQPTTPKPAPLNKFDFEIKTQDWELSRYQGLLEGGLFFEKIPTAVQEVVENIFHTRLRVYGIVKGGESRAVVGLEGDPSEETWIVKPGSTVEGETIITIGANYIEVRNESGAGKVFLKE